MVKVVVFTSENCAHCAEYKDKNMPVLQNNGALEIPFEGNEAFIKRIGIIAGLPTVGTASESTDGKNVLLCNSESGQCVPISLEEFDHVSRPIQE